MALGQLSAGLGLFPPLWRRAYLPLGAVVVSAAAYAGIPAGNDTLGLGTAASPYATLTKALTVVAPGGVIVVNGDPLNPSVYTPGTLFTVTKPCEISPVWPFGARLRPGSNTVRVVEVNLTSAGTVRLGALYVDGNSFTNGCVRLANTAVRADVVLNGTRLEGFKLYGLYSDVAVRGLVRAQSCYVSTSLSGCRTGIYFPNLVEGGLDIQDTSIMLTNQALSGHGGVIANASASGCSFAMRGSVVTVALDPLLTGTGYHMGVMVTNIEGATVSGSSVSVVGPYGSRSATPLGVSVDLTTPLTAHNFRLVDCVLYNGTNGGHTCKIGEEDAASAAANGKMNGGIVERCTVRASASARAGTVHGFYVGSRSDATVRRCVADGVGLGLVCKGALGNAFYSNVVLDPGSNGILLKGTFNSVVKHNTVYAKAAGSNAVEAQVNQTTGDNCSGCVVEANSLAVLGSSTAYLVNRQDGSQGVTFNANNYHVVGGTSAAAFLFRRDASTTYSATSAWVGAMDAAGAGFDPQFEDLASGLVRPLSPSMDFGPPDPLVPFDFAGTAFSAVAPTVGAYQRQP